LYSVCACARSHHFVSVDMDLGTLTYFPLYAKGLAPTLVAEHSGLPYKGNRDTGFTMEQWGALKNKNKAPFGQLPILDTGSFVVGQTTAICNYIGRAAGTDGADVNDYTMSQMLMAEGEDLYNLMQKYQPTIFVKEKEEDNRKFWTEVVPGHMKKLEALMPRSGGGKAAGCFVAILPCVPLRGGATGAGFTSTSTSPGELLLFSILYQMNLVNSGFMRRTPRLESWFQNVQAMPATARVLAGESAMGKLQPYFIEAGATEPPVEPKVVTLAAPAATAESEPAAAKNEN